MITTHVRRDGTIRLPDDVKLSREVHETLRGHASSDGWLPRGLVRDLDDVRQRHAELRQRLIDRLDELMAVRVSFNTEDAKQREAEQQAAREGTEVIDRRTSPAARAERIDYAQRQVRAAAEVLAECVDEAVACVRGHESAILASLREQHEEAEQKRREAAELLRQAAAHEFRLVKLGQWTQKTAESSGSFDRPPAPTGDDPAPTQLDRLVVEHALTRHWTREGAAA